MSDDELIEAGIRKAFEQNAIKPDAQANFATWARGTVNPRLLAQCRAAGANARPTAPASLFFAFRLSDAWQAERRRERAAAGAHDRPPAPLGSIAKGPLGVHVSAAEEAEIEAVRAAQVRYAAAEKRQRMGPARRTRYSEAEEAEIAATLAAFQSCQRPAGA